MVSFSCEGCGDVLTKKKLDPHRNRCHNASFTCIDCMVHFQGNDYRAHTSCISEAQKYQGHLYREKDNKKSKNRKSLNNNQQQQNNNSQAMTYKNAYVEDAPDGDSQVGGAVAVVDVPPRAPTPPSRREHAELPDNVNVFDYLVQDATPNGRALDYQKHDSQTSNGDDSHYRMNGYSYGSSTVTPSFQRYESHSQYDDSQNSQSLMPPPYVTPAPKSSKDKHLKSTTTTDKKRKRSSHIEDLDLSASKRPVSRDGPNTDTHSTGRVLHSGLTGGLSRLITDPEFYDDRIDAGPTPVSPLKRNRRDAEFEQATTSRKHNGSQVSASHTENPRQRKRSTRHHRDSFSSADGNDVSSTAGQLTTYDRSGAVLSRADLFLSFITKGPDSERGLSVHKAMKRYHRERRDLRHDEREDDDKELFKSLRLRRNDKGEIVLFVD